MTRADKLLTAGVLCVAILAAVAMVYRSAAFTNTPSPTRALISVQGKVVRIEPLSDNGVERTFNLSGRSGHAVVEVAGKRIRMAEASCPGHICVAQGWIGRPGESIVCVPGEIVIHIEGSAPVDAVTR